MSRVIIGMCSECGEPIYTYTSYIIGKFHISCNCMSSVLLSIGIPHLIDLPMPFIDSHYEEEE